MIDFWRVTLPAALVFLLAAGCGDNDSKGNTTSGSPATDVDAGDEHDAGVATNPGAADLPALSGDTILPIVFLHGFAGSASQFESQAIRFAANGYPSERIRALDHNGEGFDVSMFIPAVDEFVDTAIRDFGVSKVYLVGHSRGTILSSTYLSDPAHAAKIAKYVSLDGQGCDAADAAAIPCIAPSQQNQPGQKHVEVATSAESFEKMYQLFVGNAPTVTQIVKQSEHVQISGRVVNFPANTGRAGTTLEFYEIDAASGARKQAKPFAQFSIGDDGNWGPQTADPDKYYELALTSSDTGVQHFYAQRFLRNSHLVRLLSGGADSAASMNTNVSDRHAALTVLRMREWTGDDVLEVKETSKSADDVAPVNVLTPDVTKPYDTGMAGFMIWPIGLYLHDDAASPGVTTLDLLPYFPTQPFQSGADIYLPAADPIDGTITLTNYPRGDRTQPQVLNAPNWRSSQHFISIIFSDSPQ
jgi:pimeloyl-ACP methyl ester carboxylesterase